MTTERLLKEHVPVYLKLKLFDGASECAVVKSRQNSPSKWVHCCIRPSRGIALIWVTFKGHVEKRMVKINVTEAEIS